MVAKCEKISSNCCQNCCNAFVEIWKKVINMGKEEGKATDNVYQSPAVRSEYALLAVTCYFITRYSNLVTEE